jgi:hypothetical protein
MKSLPIVLTIAILLATASTSDAQYGYGRRRGYGGGGGTAASNYMYGMSSVIQAEGAYNLMTAQASIAAQQAESQYLQNRLAATQTYFEMRQMNKQYRDQERAKPMSGEALTHYYEQMKPKRMVPTQLDPVTGQITWPLPLQDEAYASYREQLESVYKLRAQHKDFNYNDVRVAAEGMQAEFRKHLDEFAPQDFENSNKFLEALAVEAHYPLD